MSGLINHVSVCHCEEQLSPRIQSHRAILHREMGLSNWLQGRACFHLGDQSLHYEYYFCDDAAPWLIFLPGIGTYVELYAELLMGFRNAGYNVVAMDYPGHGYSAGKRGVYSIGEVSSGVSQLVDAIRSASSTPVYLFGYSIGGMLATATAERDPRIEAVVCQTLLVPDVAPDLFHQLGWFWISSSSWFFPGLRVPLSNIVDYDRLLEGNPAGPYLKADPLCVYDYPLSTLNSLFSWRAQFLREPTDFPILMLHGEEDEVLPLEYAENVLARSQGDLTLHVLEGGHMLPWDAPAALVQQTDVWLSSLRPL